MNVRSRLSWIFTVDDLSGIELVSGFAMLFLGLWLLLPFISLVGNPVFAPLTVISSHDESWAILFLQGGILQFVGMGTKRIGLRRISTLVSFLVWAFMTVMTGIGNPASLASPTYAALTVVSGIAYLRISLTDKGR